MSVGENIKKFRLEKGWTQKKLGEECKPKIAESTIRRYELGKLNPKLETVQKIAEALKVSATDLDPRISGDISFLEQKLEDLRKQEKKALQSFSQNEIFGDEFNSTYNTYKAQKDHIYQQLKELTKNTDRQKLYETTGETIKRIRLKRGLSITDMSAKTKLPVTLLYRIENNLRSLTMDTLFKISKCLDVAAIDIDANVAFDWGFDIKTDGDKLHDQLLDTFEKLNIDGQQKAVEQIEILSKIPEYQEQEPEEDDI